jgi:hypothetical protein
MSTVVDLATCSYKEFRPSMGLGVRTSIGTPRWIKRDEPWPYVPELAPQRSYLRLPEPEFDGAYLAQLGSYGVARIREQLDQLAAEHQADRLVLLCFERLTEADCHRRLFASWWLLTTGQRVPELGEHHG